MRKASKGFTLIELMAVVAIIAILAVIAYPSYEQYVLRANRSEAKNQLLRIASEQEKFFTTFNRYSASITGARTGVAATSGLNMDASTQEDPSDQAYYDIAVVLGPNALTYTLRAVPSGAFQSTDPCGALTLTNNGVRDAEGASAPPNCW